MSSFFSGEKNNWGQLILVYPILINHVNLSLEDYLSIASLGRIPQVYMREQSLASPALFFCESGSHL